MWISVVSIEWLFLPLFPGRIWIWEYWFLWWEENCRTQRKTLEAGTRANNKLNPHMAWTPRIEPGPHWREASECFYHCAIPTPAKLRTKGGHQREQYQDIGHGAGSLITNHITGQGVKKFSWWTSPRHEWRKHDFPKNIHFCICQFFICVHENNHMHPKVDCSQT